MKNNKKKLSWSKKANFSDDKGSNENRQRLLTGKNMLITGACSNIGRSIAQESARHGANIYFTDIIETKIKELERQLSQDFQVKSRGFLSDVSQAADNDRLMSQLSESNVDINCLINNVGIKLPAPSVRNIKMKDFEKIFHTNVFGPLYLTGLITDKMVKRHIQGSIIFLSSIHQWIKSRNVLYSSSKAAIGMIVKELASDLLPNRIRVNAIAPGWVESDKKGRTLSARDRVLHKTSINPLYIARAVVYLASEHFSRFTTGTVLKIDGGYTLSDS
jgi:NAD(P)-dependent dehydrogenase (short-subunit alcohol dehydrogenase family)